jgi:autotransporter-associated beta strand protein
MSRPAEVFRTVLALAAKEERRVTMVSTNRICLFVLWAFALLGLAIISEQAAAVQLLQVKFGDVGTGYPTGFTPVTSFDPTTVTGSDLSSYTVQAFTSPAGGFYNGWDGGDSLTHGAVYDNASYLTGYVKVDISGLSAGSYDLTTWCVEPSTANGLYYVNPGAGTTGLMVTIANNGANSSTDPSTYGTGTYTITGSTLEFIVTGNNGSGNSARVNGFTLTPNSNPPPPPPALTWNAGGGNPPSDGDGAWTAANNWWNGTASTDWSDGRDAIFGVGGTAGVVEISGTVQPTSITFNATGSGNYTISGGAIDLGGLPVTITANVGATIDSTITNGGLIKTGTAALVLLGNNNYSGVTTISDGTLQIGNNTTAGSISQSIAIQDNGMLVFNRFDTLTQGTDFAGGISGSGSVTQAGSGTLVLNGVNTYNGGTTVSGGTLWLDDNGILSTGVIRGPLTINSGATVDASNRWAMGYETGVTSIAVNGGTLNFHGNPGDGGISAKSITMTGGTISGVRMDWYNNGGPPQFTLTTNASNVSSVVSNDLWLRMEAAGGNVTFDVADGSVGDDLLISGNILTDGGTAGITKTGAGTMTLTGANDYTGDTIVEGGTLSINSAYLSDTGAVKIETTAMMDLNFEGIDTVGSVWLGGINRGAGTFNSTTWSEYFTGSGSLYVAVITLPGNYWAPGASGGQGEATDHWTATVEKWATGPGVQGFGPQATTGALIFTDDPGTAGVVVDGTVTAIAGLTFEVDGYNLVAGIDSPAISLTGADTAANIITVVTGTATIGVDLTADKGMTKAGDGTLILAGNSTAFGGLATSAGTLEISSGGTLDLGAMWWGADVAGTSTVKVGGELKIGLEGWVNVHNTAIMEVTGKITGPSAFLSVGNSTDYTTVETATMIVKNGAVVDIRSGNLTDQQRWDLFADRGGFSAIEIGGNSVNKGELLIESDASTAKISTDSMMLGFWNAGIGTVEQNNGTVELTFTQHAFRGANGASWAVPLNAMFPALAIGAMPGSQGEYQLNGGELKAPSIGGHSN